MTARDLKTFNQQHSGLREQFWIALFNPLPYNGDF